MNIEIENIDKIENIHKHHNIYLRTTYKVIQKYFFEETYIFPEDFFKQWKNNENEPQNISTNVKNNLKTIAMEQILYAQVGKDLSITE